MTKRLLVRTQVVVLVFAFVGVVFAPEGEAACAAPSISVTPATGSPGSNVTIAGQDWAAECNDTVNCQAGQQCTEPPPSPPSRGIVITFRQGDRSWPLTTIDAGPDYTFKVSTGVPSDAQPGAATIEAPTAQPVPFTVGATVRTQIEEKKEKLGQLRGKGKLRKELRERLKDDQRRLVADPDDEDVWVSYLAAGLALGLIALGVLMLRRRPTG